MFSLTSRCANRGVKSGLRQVERVVGRGKYGTRILSDLSSVT